MGGGSAPQATKKISSDPRLASAPSPDPNPISATTHPLQNAHLILHVGKTGTLARLGHNHLITAPLSGTAWLDEEGTLHATVAVRADELIVDDPQQRAAQVAAGNADYTSLPSAKNIRDTRANMLGAQVLNAARYPQISATARAAAAAAEFASATAGSLNAQFTLILRDSTSDQSARLDWQRQNNDIIWSTAFTLSHQQMGMTPFSALGGALRVADDLRIELQGTLPDPFSLGSD